MSFAQIGIQSYKVIIFLFIFILKILLSESEINFSDYFSIVINL